MKITKQQLKQIIKEEVEATILNENVLLGAEEARTIAADPELIKQLFQLVPSVVSLVTGQNMLGMYQSTLEDLYNRIKTAQ